MLIETSGERDISELDTRVIRIMDLKCPDSGEVERNRWANLENLRARDEVKFVISSRGTTNGRGSDRGVSVSGAGQRGLAKSGVRRSWNRSRWRSGYSRIGWRRGCSYRCISIFGGRSGGCRYLSR